MAVEVEIDVQVLKSEIKKTYASVSQEPEKDFIFTTGRPWAAAGCKLRRRDLERRYRPDSG